MVASPLIELDLPLPLRTLVLQDDGGQVWISYKQPAFLAQRYSISPDLATVIAGVEGTVEAALHNAPPQ
jgi:uncharacterized protein (DUF302 family)